LQNDKMEVHFGALKYGTGWCWLWIRNWN